jgi:hypothetical protein
MIYDIVYRASSSHTYTGKLLLSYATLLVTRLTWSILVTGIVNSMLLLDAPEHSILAMEIDKRVDKEGVDMSFDEGVDGRMDRSRGLPRQH